MDAPRVSGHILEAAGSRRVAPSGRAGLPSWSAPAATVGIVAVAAIVLLAMGRVPICTCSTVKLFHAAASSPETSQHLADPYTFTHVLHGVLFYGAFVLLRRATGLALPFAAGLLLATIVEAGWEILENTPLVIERYRATTISLEYYGDSVVNSLGDIAAMMAGFWLASRLPAWASVAGAVATEILLAYAIRDNLTLNVIMLLMPLDAIKAWQAGA